MILGVRLRSENNLCCCHSFKVMLYIAFNNFVRETIL